MKAKHNYGLPALNPIKGVEISTTAAHIKTTGEADLTLFHFAPNSTCAAVFTRNAFCAAPVTIARQHLQQTQPRYWLINAGNANAGTGEAGYQDALRNCAAVAEAGKCETNEVLPFSTGVIGERLPMDKLLAAIPPLFTDLNPKNWEGAARAIMTTDTQPKGKSVKAVIQKQPVTLTGIVKGAGMIKPNMATLLAFIATDAAVSHEVLQACLQYAADHSFNRITVDGDTSTNDACMLVATGQGRLQIDSVEHPGFAAFQQLVTELCVHLAKAVIYDAEGASKFITIVVEQGASIAECETVAYTLAHSPLVKTAFYASDANWGRILAAVGRAEIADLAIEQVRIYLDEVCIVEHGGVAAHYTEAQGQAVMQQAEITIRVLLGRGEKRTQIWTCDLSHEYVSINADYRT